MSKNWNAPDMENLLIERCVAKGLTVAVAESCTGGLLGASITSAPGASAVFKGGIISYANDIKNRVLQVPTAVLESDGAVSKSCAEAMVRGALKLFEVDLAAAVTGIAGPSGGTVDKPVGLVYIAVASADAIFSREFRFEGDRSEVRRQSVAQALSMLLQLI
jgi:PncC family amidohydrolase